MVTRRDFLKLTAATGAGLMFPLTGNVARASAPSLRARAALPGGSQDPAQIAKYSMPLVIPPAMPPTQRTPQFDFYKIAVRQFQQQILPTGMPKTTVWSYGSTSVRGTFNYPAFTIEAAANRPVRVKWINGLVDPRTGKYLPHLLPVDPTLHWANPAGPIDTRPTFMQTPGPYKGPVPMVTHVHGAHVGPESDGYPEAWWLPDANNLAGYTTQGSHYDQFDRANKDRGTAVFQYPNDQRAATLWYHDHTLGMTRLNVYAGPAGFYLVRGGDDDLPNGVLPGPAPGVGADPFGVYYEIPIAIQDRSFNADGSLFFPDSRAFFDGFTGPYIPDSDISPIYNSESFGNTIVVNGRTWPYLNVEPRSYRFRFLNGCNSRFLILKMVTKPLARRPAQPALSFWRIGTEGGFLPAPVQQSQLLMGLAERADVIVDFSGLKPGTEIFLINEGPDEPFNGEFNPSDPATTGQVMKFVVVPKASKDISIRPDQLVLPAFTGLGVPINARQVSLNEADSEVLPDIGPQAAFLGTVGVDTAGMPIGMPMMWSDSVTEMPSLGATEVWEIHNFTGDAHPIHLHQVQFQVVGREAIGGGASVAGSNAPMPWETGYKDTVIAYPGEITRIKARFDLPGRYVWHCHIVDHEDNEMMRPLIVG